MDCHRLDEFYDGEMSATDHAAFGCHLAYCAKCQADLEFNMQLSAAAMRRPGWVRRNLIRLCDLAESCLDAHDAARETLVVVLGIANLVRQAGQWAAVEVIRRVTPEPVRSMVRWHVEIDGERLP